MIFVDDGQNLTEYSVMEAADYRVRFFSFFVFFYLFFISIDPHLCKINGSRLLLLGLRSENIFILDFF